MQAGRDNVILTIPNIFTWLRMAAIPVILWQMWKGQFGWALALFAGAAVSDLLDGLLARWLRQKTLLGMYLDPVADKLLLSSCFLVLALTGEVPWVVAGLVLTRDAGIVVVVVVLVLTTSMRRFPPTRLGKANTLVQVVTVFVVMLDIVYGGEGWALARRSLMILAPALVLASGLHYAYLTVRKLWGRGRTVDA